MNKNNKIIKNIKQKYYWFKIMHSPIRDIRYKIQEIKINNMVKRNIKKGYISENGKPLKCHKCGCTDLEEYDCYCMDGGYIEEYSVKCKKCDEELGHWAYGYWDRNYMI